MQAKTLNGRYRLDESIGEGGMAVVYRGYDLVLDRVVAVKILRDQYGRDENFLRRFEREAQSAARLTHPNIVNVFDVGEDNDTRFIVMEYIHGPSLKDLIRRQGPFSVEGAAFVLRQITRALDYAHSRGLVHRDIKPQNILVDENGNAKVVDFGIAKGLSDSNLTEAGTGMGTVHYVSPEQARGERATPSSDIYSTGVVLYEMLTKRLPFEADNPVGVAMQHVSADPPPPSQFNPAIPPEVEDIVLTALAKDPAYRFQTADELTQALDHWGDWHIDAGDSQTTRVMGAGAAATTVRPARPRSARVNERGGRNGNAPPSRQQTFRDDVGCVTWLIGSAILIGLIGIVVLGYQLGDFTFLDPQESDPTVTPVETQVVAAATPTMAPTPEPSPTMDETTPEPTEEAEPTPTLEPTPTEGPEMINVPSLIGSTLDQARIAVQPGEFVLIEEEVYNNLVPAGEIIDQEPRAQTPMEKGSQIRIQVSRGPEFIPLADVQGQPVSQARANLEERGLTVTVVEETSTSVAEGRVIRTEPATQVRAGGSVTIYASLGDRVRVPNVLESPLDQASFRIQEAGLTLGTAAPQSCEAIRQSDSEFDCDSFPDGHVVSMSLNPGDLVARGTTINLTYYDAGNS